MSPDFTQGCSTSCQATEAEVSGERQAAGGVLPMSVDRPVLAMVAPAQDSHAAPPKPSRIPAPLREADLLQRMLWSVRESAFMCRVGIRTVWRLMADPKSGFPKPRRIGARTLLMRDDVLAFLAKGAAR